MEYTWNKFKMSSMVLQWNFEVVYSSELMISFLFNIQHCRLKSSFTRISTLSSLYSVISSHILSISIYFTFHHRYSLVSYDIQWWLYWKQCLVLNAIPLLSYRNQCKVLSRFLVFILESMPQKMSYTANWFIPLHSFLNLPLTQTYIIQLSISGIRIKVRCIK